MKTKILFLVCLFIGIATVMSSAQDNSNRANQGWNTYSGLAIPVFCDGELIDVLLGELDFHYVIRSFKDTPYAETDQLKGELTSEATGEIFRARRTDKWEASFNWVWTCTISYSFIGNKGTIYSGKIFLNYSADPIQRTFDHLNCH